MSLAWSSLVILLLLLPGVLFFVGLYMPEQFTRETAERTPLGQLAAVLVVSFFVQGGLFAIVTGECNRTAGSIPCIDLAQVMRVMLLDKPDDRVAAMLTRFWPFIILYMGFASALGVGLGYLTGHAVVSGILRGITQHPWIYDLSVGDNFTVAYVMTHVRHEERVLLYRGFLKQFGLQRDGCFSYIVLTEARRGYMLLEPTSPRTTAARYWKTIGEAPASISREVVRGTSLVRAHGYFVIEGEDVANVVFDRLKFRWDGTSEDLAEVLRNLESEFTDEPASRPAPQKRKR